MFSSSKWTMEADRRKELRVYHSGFESCRVLLDSPDTHWDARLTDASAGGLGVAFSEGESLPGLGQELDVCVLNTEDVAVIKGRGHLAWMNPGRPEGGIELVPQSLVSEALLTGKVLA